MKLGSKEISNKLIYSVSIIAIIAIMFIPMLYSFIYLKAFWDPYSNLENVPVAFVNLDKSIVKNGKEYNIGTRVVDSLKKNNKVKWKFVNYDEAKSGVEGTEYYAMIVIPKDFSQRIANSTEGNLKDLKIIYESNKGKNFIFSQISSRVADEIKNEVASQISKEGSKALIDNLYTAKNAIGKASDATEKLADGTKKLEKGSEKLTNGIFKAAEGSKTLQEGLSIASNGQKKLVSGYDTLIYGLIQLRDNLSIKDERIPQLVNGASDLADGITKLKTSVSSGSQEMSKNLNAAADGIHQVSDNLNKARTLISASEENLKTGNITPQDIQNIMTAKSILDAIGNKNIDALIASPLRDKSDSMQPIITVLSKLEDGAYKVSGGTMQIAKAIEENQNNAATGVNSLIAGSYELKNGTGIISDGLDNAALKTKDLFVGLDKLNNGASAIKDGLKYANDGSSKLKDGLNRGYNKMNEKLKFSSDGMSDFISNPVGIEEKNINDIKYYGEGLAPYFISLSLWLGAMFVNIIITLIKFINSSKNKFLKSFTGKFILGSIGTIIQAIILTLALQKGLKIDTVNISYFYLNNMLTALVFFSIMYGLSCALGGISTPIIFILLLLQLASCGGTFPIEAAPSVYRTIGKFLPMTYSVKLIRMIIAGINPQIFKQNINIMIEFAVSFLITGFILKSAKDNIANRGFKLKNIRNESL